MYVFFGKRCFELGLKHVFNAGDHEIHKGLRRVHNAVDVGDFYTEALEKSLVNSVKELLFFAEVAYGFGGLLDGNIEMFKVLDKSVATERARGQRLDHFLDLLCNNIAAHEIANIEYLAENALGKQMLEIISSTALSDRFGLSEARQRSMNSVKAD